MPPKSRERKSRQLTPESFHRLVAELGEDPQQAGARYERLRDRLVLFFLRRMLASPEELADHVIDRLAARLVEGQTIASVEGYALGIARHVAQEQLLLAAREVVPAAGVLENISARNHTEDVHASRHEEDLATMEACLAELAREDVDLLRSYYVVERNDKIETRRTLATGMKMTQAALRKRIFSLASQLRASVRARASAEEQAAGVKRTSVP